MKFIKLTEFTGNNNEVIVNVEMIQAMYVEGKRTRLMHPSHNNGGWYIKETPEEILKLIEKAKAL